MRAWAVALLLAVVACGDSTGDTVVFGEGVIPPAVPDDFPIPADAAIGATLVDTINSKSEFEFRTATDLEQLVPALSVGLVEAGYVVESSSGDVLTWTISFRRGSLEGSVEMRSLAPGVAQGVVTVNDA